MLTRKKIFGLITLFIGLTFAQYSISTGQGLADTTPKKVAMSGTVVNAATQNPVSGVNVEIPLANKKVETGQQGQFTIEGLNPGTYKLKIDHKGYKSYSKSVKVPQQSSLMIKLKPAK